MNLFHLEAEHEQDEPTALRTWLVAAESLLDAISLVPDGYTMKSAEAQLGGASEPGRVIGWMGPPPRGLGEAQSGKGPARCATYRHPRPGAHEHRTNGWFAQRGP